MLANRRFVGGIGGVHAGEEHRHGVCVQAPSNVLELGGGEGLGVAVGESGQAREYLPFYVLRRRHCNSGDAGVLVVEWLWSRWWSRLYLRQHRR